MFTTYKLIKGCTNSTLLARDLNDLVEDYRNTNNARERNRLIATIFCKLYPMILKLQQKFHTLTVEQKIEHALYHLVKSLNNYDSTKMKFSSFFYVHLTNQFKSLLTAELSNKRKVFQNISVNNDYHMEHFAQTAFAKPYEKTDAGFLNEIKHATYLSSEEKDYCGCVVAGIDKLDDIAKVLKVDKIDSIRKPLISNPYATSPEEDKARKEKLAVDRIRKIKASIKKKGRDLAKKGIDIFRD